MDTTAGNTAPIGTASAPDDEWAGAPGLELSPFLRVCLAAFSAGAGVIHLVMAPIHAGESTAEAVGFALSGWFQLVLAVVVLVRPRRGWVLAAIPANLAFIGVWAVSRTAGLPFGSHSGVAEKVGAADLTCVVLEGLVVLTAVVALARPRLLAGLSAAGLVMASTIPVGALVATSLVVVSPTTAQHSHGDETASVTLSPVAQVEATRCDKAVNPVSYWREAQIAGIDTVSRPDLVATAAPAAPVSDGHDHSHGSAAAAAPSAGGTTPTTRPDPLQGRGSPKLDKIMQRMGSDSEVDAGFLVAQLPELSDAEYEAFLLQVGKANAGHTAHATTGDDTHGHGGHIGPNPWVAMTDKAQCDALNGELAKARDAALAVPTAADAKAAGYTQVTPYVPGIGAHWMNFSYVDGKFEVDKPEMILYDGDGLDASVVGLSYYVVQNGDAEPTQGFTGDNDHYHRHIGLCVKDALVIADSTSTKEQCEALGGKKQTGGAGWMSHAWVVPGCESPWGVFSGASPVLDKKLSEHSGTDGGHCKGSEARKRYDLSPGTTTQSNPPPKSSEVAAGN